LWSRSVSVISPLLSAASADGGAEEEEGAAGAVRLRLVPALEPVASSEAVRRAGGGRVYCRG
jgi:hypothetical protein